MKKVDKRATALAKPIPGQSHWCSGNNNTCAQVVRDGQDHCEARHPNPVNVGPFTILDSQAGFNASLPSGDVDDAFSFRSLALSVSLFRSSLASSAPRKGKFGGRKCIRITATPLP